MSKDQVIGAVITLVCVFVAVAFLVLLFLYDPYIASVIDLGSVENVRYWLVAAPVTIAFFAILGIGAWIGLTMAKTPPPKPIEQISSEAQTENKTS